MHEAHVDPVDELARNREIPRAYRGGQAVIHIIGNLDRVVKIPSPQHGQEQGADASEANLEVLEKQLTDREPLTGDELAARHAVQAEVPDIEAALGMLMTQRVEED